MGSESQILIVIIHFSAVFGDIVTFHHARAIIYNEGLAIF